VLAARALLPVKPEGVTLRGRFMTLAPYDARAHAGGLYRALYGAAFAGHPAYDAEALVWRYLGGVRGGEEAAVKHFAALRDAPDARMFVMLAPDELDPTPGSVRGAARPSPSASAATAEGSDSPATAASAGTSATGGRPATVIGMVSLMRNAPEHLSCEIGWVAATPAYQATPVVSEASALLLRHAFALGYQRVEWKCNALNARSRAAALRLGFTYEGTFRMCTIIQGGHSRDTAWFALLAPEWRAAAGAKLDAWLASDEAAELAARRRRQLAALTPAAPP
jgi:RimJ/RimL family protein N-acetyltransferase